MAEKLSILCFQKLSPELQNLITELSPDIKLTVFERKDGYNPNLEIPDDIDIVLAWGQHNLDSFLPKMPNLKWIQVFTAGVDQLLTPAVASLNIPITNTKGIHGIPISEYVFANLLNYYKKLPLLQEQQKNKIWKPVVGEEIFNQTIGIIGLGAIGREIAKRAKSFGLEVLASKRHQTDELFIDELYSDTELDQLLPLCDIVLLSLPLTPETKHLFNKDKFKLMRPNACFINVSRGSVVVESDLIEALQTNEIAHAILDVFETEPLPETSLLWELPNVTLTPHISATSPPYLNRAVHVFVENLQRYLKDKPLTNVIDLSTGY